MEMWKTIDGFENYRVSTAGRVMNVETGKYLTPFSTKRGYQVVNPSMGGVAKKAYVHRIVAKAFLPAVQGKTQVNHINGIKFDNRIENLEWCTSSENHMHRSRVLGVKRSSEHMSKMCDLARLAHHKPVVCVETKVVFDSVTSAAKSVDRNPSSIVDVLKGRHETCGGFHWIYSQEGDVHR